MIVLVPPSFDQHFRLSDCIEDFAIEPFIPSWSIETLMIAILPRAAWLDTHGPDAKSVEPLLNGLRRTFLPSVGPQIVRRSMLDKQFGQPKDHSIGAT